MYATYPSPSPSDGYANYNVDESYFRPPVVTTFDAGILSTWDDISPSALATIESLYPPQDFDYNETTRFLQADADFQFDCKIYALTYAFSSNPSAGNLWSYYFSVPPAIHTTDDPYTFNGGPHEADGFVTNETVANNLQQYLISFIKTGNPNTEFPGLLEWPTYDSQGGGVNSGGVEINFNQSFIELIVSTDLDTPQCQWWVQGLY